MSKDNILDYSNLTPEKVGGFTDKITVDSTANGSYTLGQSVGGVIKIPSILRNLSTTGIIFDIALWGTVNSRFGLVIDFWNDIPTGVTDKTTVNISGLNNVDKWLGCKVIDSSDWDDLGTISRVHIPNVNISTTPKVIDDRLDAIKDLYCTITTKESVTIGVLTVKIGILQD